MFATSCWFLAFNESNRIVFFFAVSPIIGKDGRLASWRNLGAAHDNAIITRQRNTWERTTRLTRTHELCYYRVHPLSRGPWFTSRTSVESDRLISRSNATLQYVGLGLQSAGSLANS